jgi:starch synthase
LSHTDTFSNRHETEDRVAAKFEVTASGSQYRWTLTSQGRTLATSPPYARKALAQKAMTSFRLAAVAAPVIDTTAPAAKPAVAKAARRTGRAVGKAAGATTKVTRTAARTTAKAPTTVRKTAAKAAKAVEKTAAKAARTAGPRKRTARAR